MAIMPVQIVGPHIFFRIMYIPIKTPKFKTAEDIGSKVRSTASKDFDTSCFSCKLALSLFVLRLLLFMNQLILTKYLKTYSLE